MALIDLSDERLARELERSLAAERRMQAELRRMRRLLAAMVCAVFGELFFFGGAMAVTSREAVLAFTSAALLCAVAPLFIIIIDQLRRD